MDSLDVYFERQKVGELINAPEGLMFSYSLHWLGENPEPMPISLSLPIQSEPQEARAFFANLLPEGVVREYLCKNVFRLDYGDDFALLKAISRKTVRENTQTTRDFFRFGGQDCRG